MTVDKKTLPHLAANQLVTFSWRFCNVVVHKARYAMHICQFVIELAWKINKAVRLKILVAPKRLQFRVSKWHHHFFRVQFTQMKRYLSDHVKHIIKVVGWLKDLSVPIDWTASSIEIHTWRTVMATTATTASTTTASATASTGRSWPRITTSTWKNLILNRFMNTSLKSVKREITKIKHYTVSLTSPISGPRSRSRTASWITSPISIITPVMISSVKVRNLFPAEKKKILSYNNLI